MSLGTPCEGGVFLPSCSGPEQTHQPGKRLGGTTRDEPSNRIKRGQRDTRHSTRPSKRNLMTCSNMMNPELMQESQNGSADPEGPSACAAAAMAASGCPVVSRIRDSALLCNS